MYALCFLDDAMLSRKDAGAFKIDAEPYTCIFFIIVRMTRSKYSFIVNNTFFLLSHIRKSRTFFNKKLLFYIFILMCHVFVFIYVNI